MKLDTQALRMLAATFPPQGDFLRKILLEACQELDDLREWRRVREEYESRRLIQPETL